MKKKDLNEKKVAELRALAKASGLAGCAKLRKAELVDALVAKAKSRAGAEARAASKPKPKAKPKPQPRIKAKAAAKPAAKPAKKTRAAAPRSRPKGARSAREKAGGDERWEALSPRTARAFSLYRARCEQRVKASKYYLGVQESAELDEGFEFPESYGESAITLMVRDPYWLFAYWEFAPNLNAELRARLGDDALAKSRLVLRVYDVTGTSPEHAASFHDIDVAPGARNWYINVMRVERDYCVDLGLIAPDGSFIVIARSNMVSLPPVGPSEVVDEEWVTLEALGEFYARTELGPSSGSGGWGSGGWGR